MTVPSCLPLATRNGTCSDGRALLTCARRSSRFRWASSKDLLATVEETSAHHAFPGLSLQRSARFRTVRPSGIGKNSTITTIYRMIRAGCRRAGLGQAVAVWCLVLAVWCCGPAPPPDGEPPARDSASIFREISAEAGLDFVHRSGAAGEFYLPEIMGSGGALFDYDNDGDLDAYLVQSGSLGSGEAAKTASTGMFSLRPGREMRRNSKMSPIRPASVTAATGWGSPLATTTTMASWTCS